ncbi:MAG: hypothetical protein NWF01_07840 [Candidatus Bathyarchaeota archaeon]|nr:hypothetical protein [Candidatus Bathyarchaeota archaeon]
MYRTVSFFNGTFFDEYGTLHGSTDEQWISTDYLGSAMSGGITFDANFEQATTLNNLDDWYDPGGAGYVWPPFPTQWEEVRFDITYRVEWFLNYFGIGIYELKAESGLLNVAHSEIVRWAGEDIDVQVLSGFGGAEGLENMGGLYEKAPDGDYATVGVADIGPPVSQYGVTALRIQLLPPESDCEYCGESLSSEPITYNVGIYVHTDDPYLAVGVQIFGYIDDTWESLGYFAVSDTTPQWYNSEQSASGIREVAIAVSPAVTNAGILNINTMRLVPGGC